jgi:hypothetical protein
MKTITRTKIYLPVAALILTAALAVPAAAESLIPFKGAYKGLTRTERSTPQYYKSLPAARETARISANSHLRSNPR